MWGDGLRTASCCKKRDTHSVNRFPLLDTAEEITFERGRLLLRLEVREDNERGLELFRRNGYRPIGRYLDYYADHTTALRYEKTVRGDVPLNAPTPMPPNTPASSPVRGKKMPPMMSPIIPPPTAPTFTPRSISFLT